MKRVLVIGWEADFRNFVSKVLELEGYSILQTGDVDEGLRLAREHHIALVLLDIKPPEANSLGLLQQVQAAAELSSIPVLVVSTSTEVSLQKEVFKRGAAAHLVKPVSAATLKNAIRLAFRGASE